MHRYRYQCKELMKAVFHPKRLQRSLELGYNFHRDMKPDNIMLNENYQFILIDFGLSLFSNKENEIKQKNAPNN